MIKASRFAFAAALLVALGATGCAERRADTFRRQADALYRLGRYDEAIPYYQRAAELLPRDAPAQSALGRCHAAKGNFNLAVEHFKKAAALDPRDAPMHDKNLALLEDAGRHDAANNLRKILNPVPPQTEAATEPRDWTALWKTAALDELLDRRDEFPHDKALPETLLLAAMIAGNQTRADELAAALPETSPLRPWYDALADGGVESAVTVAQAWAAPSGAMAPVREFALAYAMAASGARADAVRTYSDALKNWPGQNAALYGIARVFAASGMPRLGAACLENLLDRAGESVTARALLFELQNQAGMTAEARRTAEAWYALAPENPQSILALAQACLDQNDHNLAHAVLRRGIQSNPGDPRLLTALAAALLRRDQPLDALAQLAKLDETTARELPASRLEAFAGARLADWARTEACCRRFLPAQLDGPLRLLLGAALAAQGRHAEARNLLNQFSTPQAPVLALETEPDEVLTGLCAGWACFGANLYGPAAEYFDSALKTAQPAPVLPARFTCLEHEFDEAQRVVRGRELAVRYAAIPEAWLGLARVYKSVSDPDAERAALDRAAQLAPDIPTVLQARATFFERAGDPEQAIGAYRRLAEIDPEDTAVSNNLAYMLLTSGGDPAEALPYAERAADAGFADPRVLHTLGLAQFKAGKLDTARRSLARALQRRPLDPTLLLDYGQVLIACDRREEGRRQAALALRITQLLSLEFPRRAEAQKLLEGT